LDFSKEYSAAVEAKQVGMTNQISYFSFSLSVTSSKILLFFSLLWLKTVTVDGTQ
jgi:hypothetical protein